MSIGSMGRSRPLHTGMAGRVIAERTVSLTVGTFASCVAQGAGAPLIGTRWVCSYETQGAASENRGIGNVSIFPLMRASSSVIAFDQARNM